MNILASPIKYSIPRAKSASATLLKAKLTSFVPGVGNYPNADLVTSMANMVKKSSRRVIQPYKSKRYFDEIVKQAKNVPGPGSYNIGPKNKKNNKYKT